MEWEVSDLPETAIGVVGDFMMGVARDAASSVLTELVAQRLGGSGQGREALELLRQQPDSPDRRQYAASVLASALQDAEFAARLRQLVSGWGAAAPRQAYTASAGVRGDRNTVVGRDITHRKSTSFGGIGVTVVAVVALLLGVGGGAAVTNYWLGSSEAAQGGGNAGTPTRAGSGSPATHSLAPASSARGVPVVAAISPDAGPGGTVATFSANGFQPGEQVRVIWNPGSGGEVTLRDITADPAGAVAVEVAIPKDPYYVNPDDSVEVRANGLTSEKTVNTYFRFTEPVRN
ncbi:hypothetical protein [Goodfellowiella coeruleoviolacea]|uniref:Uncharacterized protein n=1 Tax=Goodfellowiella coeruleoviolacea TaxID=334858 RepID=A0AAE3KFJ1_9PSEU|nr:hypothetical protein [Goodfellowiella coeruleoviolacea]MCP2164464.1 hypothetical protein [Goodfellowiella coeruleoviolacea]